MRNNREKTNIAFAILKILQFGVLIVFWPDVANVKQTDTATGKKYFQFNEF